MSDDQQPEAVWVFPEKKRNTGRIWLIVVLAIAAVAIVSALVWFFLLPDDEEPGPTPAPTTSETSSTAPSPDETPIVDPSEPPVPDPDLATFTTTVQPRLDDAVRGLDLVTQLDGDGAVQIVDSLQIDADWLNGTAAPSSIADEWPAAVSTYATRLAELRTAYENGSDATSALDAARTALGDVRTTAGL